MVAAGTGKGTAAGTGQDTAGLPVERRTQNGGGASVVSLLCVVFCLCLGLLEVYHLRQTAALHSQVRDLQGRLGRLETALPNGMLMPLSGLRQRRSVADAPQQTNAAGIPIVDRPYGYRPGLHEAKEGLWVYDSFGTPTERPDDRNILPHHRSSAAFRGAPLGRVNTETAVSGAVAAPQALTRRPAGDRAGVHHRRSRVHQTATGTRRGRRRRLSRKRTGAKRAKSRKAAEARGAPTGFSTGPSSSSGSRRQTGPSGGSGMRRQTGPSGGSGSHRQPAGRSHGRNKRLMRMMEELRESLTTTAAHFEGHTANYSRSHPHYKGNGLLRNSQPDAMFVDWQFASWMHRHGHSKDFKLYGGQVTVTKPGVYYLYAQINYLDDSDINGFEIVVSGRSFVICVTMEASDHRQKANTCHTSGVTYLDAGDSVSIRDLERMRFSMFLPERSFFGLVRLAGTGGEHGDRRHPRAQTSWTK